MEKIKRKNRLIVLAAVGGLILALAWGVVKLKNKENKTQTPERQEDKISEQDWQEEIKEEDLAQARDSEENKAGQEETEIFIGSTFFRETNCPGCDRIETNIKKAEESEEIRIGIKNINRDKRAFNEMREKGAYCEVEFNEIKVPMLWIEGDEGEEGDGEKGECYWGEREITGFLEEFL
ncbi:MAG: hypothetical protein ABIC19_02560 [Patescibacteria group bacterium]|nr:hypothetical protein [Patescibacteria group bacterium]